MGFLALFNAYAMRICLSIAITEMVVPLNITEEFIDDTCSDLSIKQSNNFTAIVKDGTYEWSEYTQGIILSSFYWGYVITHLPGALLSEKFGGKYTLGIGIFLSAILTVLVPISVQCGGSAALIVLRVLMGFSGGVIFPALNVMTAHWAPPQELSLITAVIFIGVDIGVIGATTISGLILRYSVLGWSGVFYFFGGAGILWFILWMLLCFNNPDEHPFISDSEASYLRKSLNEHTHKNTPPVPWARIFKSSPFWALLVVQIGHDWGLYTLVTDLPKYMSSVLRFSVEYNGYLSSLPNVCAVLYCLLISWLTDKMITSNLISKTNARKINTSISTLAPALFIVGASYAGCNRVLVVVMFTLAVTLMGSSLPGIKVNSLDLSPNYAGTIMALTNGIASFTGILTPYLVGVLTPNQTLGEWRLVFWLVFCVFFVTNTFFVFFASGDVQLWNDPKFPKARRALN
ncbi:PREDICTED: putative inorganic phosphate cotransporter [Ceratosolen solmsi marchali]|uniref:Inorganic phosphate cotransporter n=1 Tax=Ceratosolen solmsi marchali TaxID=326594 RepID=A0AAJ7E3A8_9HYME|nr:PREDICTED: putative inorganic phosphate cotransporter [Ceratosolen solmsi marchali]